MEADCFSFTVYVLGHLILIFFSIPQLMLTPISTESELALPGTEIELTNFRLKDKTRQVTTERSSGICQ